MRYGHVSVFAGLLGVSFGLSGPASAVVHTWDGSSSNSWNNIFNWTPTGVPGNTDNAIIGAGPNNGVALTGNATASPVDNITLVGGTGASLTTNGFRLSMEDNNPTPDGGFLTINDGNIVLVPEVAADASLQGLDADNLRINNGGSFGNIGFSVIDNLLDINAGGTVSSAGRILVGVDGNTGESLINDGIITASLFGATDLRIDAGAGATLDLDGNGENGVIRATADAGFGGGIADANLTIDGPLDDSFGGTMEIARRDSIRFVQPWTKNAGTLTFRGDNGNDAADLNGAQLTHSGGLIEVTQGTAILNAALNMTGGTFDVAADTTVTFNGTTTIGASADLDLGADNVTININGTTSILQNATLDLDGTLSASNVVNVGNSDTLRIDSDLADNFDGTLNLAANSNLILNGQFTFNSGSDFNKSQQNIDVTIGGDVTINTDFDMDGTGSGSALTSWNLTNSGATLDIGADIETSGANTFDGVITNRGTVEIDVTGVSWTNNGTVNLVDVGIDPTVAGDTINNTGTLTGRGRFTAAVQNNNGGLIQPGGSTTAGRLNWVGAGVTFNAGSELNIDLGGLNPGVNQDRIDAVGVAINGGDIEIDRIGGYLPALYLEHIVIDSVNAISGAGGVFDTVSDLVIPATGTGWAVTYTNDQVRAQRAVLGDANLNGLVEQGDLNAVLNNWGESNFVAGQIVSWVTGDLNGNGLVEQGDLNFVLNNWGDVGAPDFGDFDLSQVPEPASLALIGTIGLFARRRPTRTARAA